jgi:hypothetical protein
VEEIVENEKRPYKNPDPFACSIMRLSRLALGISLAKVEEAVHRNWSTIHNGETGHYRLARATEAKILRFYLAQFGERGFQVDEVPEDATLPELRLAVAKVLFVVQRAEFASRATGVEETSAGFEMGADDFVERVAVAGLRNDRVPAVTARMLRRIEEAPAARAAAEQRAEARARVREAVARAREEGKELVRRAREEAEKAVVPAAEE